MRKEQLVKALLKLAKKEAQANKKAGKTAGKKRNSNGRFKSSHTTASESGKNRLKQI